MSIEEQLVDEVLSLQYDDLPPEVVTACKNSVADLLGVAVAGSTTAVANQLCGIVARWGGTPQSRVLLKGMTLPAHDAAFLNAAIGRALDFNQYHFRTGTQPTPTVIPVALATADLCGKVTGKEFITAVAVGSEVMCRMRMVPDYCSGLSGWVGDVCGIFGGTITAGRLMQFKAEQMLNALGLAYSQSAGNVQGVRDIGGGATLALQQGFSARAAMVSALLGMQGLGTSKRFLDASAGFYEVYYRGIPYDLNRLLDGFGQRYEIMNLAVKPYPSCGYTLCPIDNVLDIMHAQNLSRQQVHRIVLRVGQAAYNNVCQPSEIKYRPRTAGDAVFSIPYTIGSAILRGDVFLQDFSSEEIQNVQRLREVDKVETVLDPAVESEASRLGLRLSLNIAQVVTDNGQVYEQKMQYPRGTPENPMTFEDCGTKARRCAQYAEFAEERMDLLLEWVDQLEQLQDVSVIMDVLR